MPDPVPPGRSAGEALPADLRLREGSALLRRASEDDVEAIVALLAEDRLASRREDAHDPGARALYRAAFAAIDADRFYERCGFTASHRGFTLLL